MRLRRKSLASAPPPVKPPLNLSFADKQRLSPVIFSAGISGISVFVPAWTWNTIVIFSVEISLILKGMQMILFFIPKSNSTFTARFLISIALI